MDTTFRPETISYWSRLHDSSNNYLLLEETVFIKLSYKDSVKYSHLGGLEKVLDYERKLDLTTPPLDFVKDTMDDSNVATKDYKYYRVVFANGVDIVCNSYDELLEHMEED